MINLKPERLMEGHAVFIVKEVKELGRKGRTKRVQEGQHQVIGFSSPRACWGLDLPVCSPFFHSVSSSSYVSAWG